MHDDLLTLPFRDPVFVLAIALAVTFVVPILSERMRVPGVVGLILAGILIGPNGLNLIARDRPMVLLATVGLLYVMFIAGLEIDLSTIKKHRRHAVVFGVLCFLVPQSLGTVLGLWLGFSLPAAILLGAVIAPHTLLAYPIVSRLGITKRLAITTAIGGTIITDTLALLMLSVVTGMHSGSLDARYWLQLVGSLVLFGGVTLWAVPRVGRWLFKHVGLHRDQEFAFVVTIMFVVALFAKLLGIEAIVGAFVAGLTLNRLVPEHSALMTRVQFVGNSLFIPFFLLATGMLVDVRALVQDPKTWFVAASIVVAALVGKWVANWLTGLFFGYTMTERLTMFGLTVSHAAATLAVAMTGVKLGLFGTDTINGVILMMLVTCLLGAFMTQRFGKQVAIAAEPDAPPIREEAPERILLPIANPATAQPLTELAIHIRRGQHDEPLMPLVVVPDDSRAAAGVVEAEKLLAHAALHAASHEVPVQPFTRIGLSTAGAIVTAIVETRASVLVMGWNGERSLASRVFGSTIDQVLEQSAACVLVAHVGAPLSSFRRIVAVLPASAGRHPGYHASLAIIKRLAFQLGADLVLWTPDQDGRRVAEQAAGVQPQVTVQTEVYPSWQALSERLHVRSEANELVIIMGARPDSLTWHPDLDRLPSDLAESPQRDFLVLYPPEPEPEDEAAPASSQPRYGIFRLEAPTAEAAWHELYGQARGLVAGAKADAASMPPAPTWQETVDGALIAGVGVPGWPHSVVAVGVSIGGLATGSVAGPVHLMVACITPDGLPIEARADYLRWVARQLSEPGLLLKLRHAPDAAVLEAMLQDCIQS